MLLLQGGCKKAGAGSPAQGKTGNRLEPQRDLPGISGAKIGIVFMSASQPEIQTLDNGLLEACVDAPVAAVPGSGRGVGKAGYALGADRAECARIGAAGRDVAAIDIGIRSEEHTSALQSLMRISYAVFCLKKTKLLTTSS